MIKQREANSWKSVSYAKSITGAQTYTKFPIVLRTTEQSIPIWSIKGNTETSGTPTPSNPVSVNGVGERTENLCDVSSSNVLDWSSSSAYQYTINTDKTITISEGNAMFSGFKVKVNPSTAYTVHCAATYKGQMRIREFSDKITDWNTNFIVQSVNVTIKQIGQGYGTVAFTTTAETEWLMVTFYIDPAYTPCTLSEIMLLQGSYDRQTIPDYIPYGFKIPISSGGVTTNLYTAEPLMKIGDYADSKSNTTETRNIVRQRITQASSVNQFSRGFTVDIPIAAKYQAIYSNVAVNTDTLPAATERDGKVWINAAKKFIGFGASEQFPIAYSGNPSQSEINVFNDYLQNNEVYVWYVLETPTTETVTAPSIPTTSSPTTIDVNTSVKPSEMSLTYDGYKICKPTKIVIPEPSEWIAKSWNGYNKMVGSSIWSDGDNIYYSMAMYQYVLNKSTSTWSAKTWKGLTSFNGAYIWTDGDNIYYSFGNDQYVLNRQTSTWSAKTWKGLTSFDGGYVWTDGDNIYYSSSSNQYILDKATSTWVEKEWNGLTSFDGSSVWFEGNNIYYSYGLTRYVLNKSTSTWSEKVWTNAPYNMDGGKIWSVNGYTFYSNGTYEQYVLDKSTSTWSTKTWTGFTSFSGRNIWTDGTNIYVSDGIGKQYVLVR